MAKKSKKENPFRGPLAHRLDDAWDEDYIDEEEEGFFEFDDKGGASSTSATSSGHMDCRLTTTRWRASRRVDLGRQRRDGPGTGPRLGRGEGRRTARHDLLPRRRRFRVRGDKSDSEEGQEAEVSGTWRKNIPG